MSSIMEKFRDSHSVGLSRGIRSSVVMGMFPLELQTGVRFCALFCTSMNFQKHTRTTRHKHCIRILFFFPVTSDIALLE